MYTNTYTHIWQKYFDAGPLFPKEKENEKDDSAAAAVRASHPPSCLTPYALRLMPYAYTDARVAPALPPALRLMPYAYIDARVAAAVIPAAANTSALAQPAQRVELVAQPSASLCRPA